MLLRTTLLALAATAVTAAAAFAGVPVPSGSVVPPGGPAPAPALALPDTDDPVTVSFNVYDADDHVTRSETCDWTGYPDDDDDACLRFQSDPWPAIDAIEADGGVRAVSHTVAPAHAVDTTMNMSPRADGTWLFRVTGTSDGHDVDAGMVCSPAKRSCERWNATGARSAKKEIRAASARLKKKKSRHHR